jgi:hypothetical protein
MWPRPEVLGSHMTLADEVATSRWFLPPAANRIGLAVLGFIFPALTVGLIVQAAYSGVHPQGQAFLFGAFGALSALFIFFTLRLATLRVEITQTEIVQVSIIGRMALLISNVDSALYQSIKGSLFLHIRAGTQHIGPSTYSFSKKQIHEMRDCLLKAAGPNASHIKTEYPPPTAKQIQTIAAVMLLSQIFILGLIVYFGIQHRH